MVVRTFVALDDNALTVAANSPSLTPGSSIVNNSATPNGTIYDFTPGSGQFITIDDDFQGGRINDNRPSDHVVLDGGTLIANGTEIESESVFQLQELDENGEPFGPSIFVNIYSQNGQAGNIWGFSTSQPLNPGSQYVKIAGSNSGSRRYRDIAPCFAAGTQIRGQDGFVPVEDIRSGTRIWTRDNGCLPVRWASSSTVGGCADYAPIRFAAGVLGNDTALRVSPSHRMLFTSPRAELMFGPGPVLIPARFFLGQTGVTQDPVATVEYFHFMFEGHEIVDAQGCLTESFYPGAMALQGLEDDTRAELLSLFPELAEDAVPMSIAARTLKGYEAAVVLAA